MSPESTNTLETDFAPAAPGVAARVLLGGLRVYQVVVSPTLHALAGPGAGCRFTPSCSHYACEALRVHGALFGTVLAARRVLRCHPWGPSGADPVPARARTANPLRAH